MWGNKISARATIKNKNMKQAILILMIAAVSCTKKTECSKVVKVEQALTPFAPGTFKVILSNNDTLLTTVPYKVGQIICK